MERKKVLIAEDSTIIQHITRKVLNQYEIDLDGTERCEEVIDKLMAEDYDTVLMDISFPGMSGLECTKRIRQLKDKKKAGIPIIAVTGNAKNMSQEDFKKAGFDEVLIKPLNFDHLLRVVKQYVNA